MREMKDSRIKGIDEIPRHWDVVKTKYIARTICKGSGITKEQVYEDGDIQCIRYGEIYSKYDKECKTTFSKTKIKEISSPRYINRGDILFAGTGELIEEIGKNIVFLGEEPCLAGGDIIVLSHNQNAVFLNYALGCVCSQNQKSESKSKLKVVHISSSEIGNIRIALPPVAEQDRIAVFLDAKCTEIDALSADIQSEIDTLQVYKRSVITEAVTKGVDKSVPMKDSGLPWVGEMPSHWELVRGKYCLKYLQKPVKQDDGVITCFRDGEVTLRSKRREEGFTMSDKEIGYQGIDEGDLVVHGMDGFAGAIGISDARGKASPVLNVLDTKENKKYFMYYLRSMAYGDVFLALATGIRVRSCDLRWNKLAELSYPIPPKDEQDAIVAYIDDKLQRADEIIKEKQEQLELLADYKKSIIYEYVTGKKEVPAI